MRLRNEQYDYEMTPLCFLSGRDVTLSLRAVNDGKSLEPGHEYTVDINENALAEDSRFAGSGCTRRVSVKASDDGILRIRNTFPREGMYQINVMYSGEESRIGQFRVYALEEDMKGLYPFRGDFHVHSIRSDADEDPFTVVSNYRAYGYDYTIISDHGRYYPSLEARRKFGFGEDDKSPLTDLLIMCGEEVHLPLCETHYISCGSAFSINALVSPNRNREYMGDDPRGRSLSGNCPPVMTEEEFERMIRKRAEGIDRPIESERLATAVTDWVYEKVKEGGGLGIFVHPYWLQWPDGTMQLSEDYIYYMYARRPFDAFEVLGGERYYAQNGFQTHFYYENRAKGMDYPIVGSTDSHGSYERDNNSLICSTIVFAESNTTKDITGAVRRKYSVAVDTISPEYRLVGDFRLAKYASFLMEYWYPIHDRLCAAEGTYMREYVLGNPDAESILRSVKGQVPKLMSRYFAL